MNPTLLVMIGGAIGSAARFHLGGLSLRLLGPAFPWGTLIANVSGGLMMGLLAGTLARYGSANQPWRLFLGVGVLGGFTTFSAFTLETFGMIQRGDYMIAVGYVLASMAGAIGGLAGGVLTMRVIG